VWRVKLKHPGDLAGLVEEGAALNLSAALIHAVHEIRECLMDDVYELVVFHLSFPKDHCTICKSFISPSERYIIYEDLGHIVHERCLTRLRERVGRVLVKADRHARKEIYGFIIKEWPISATIAYRVVYGGEDDG